MKRTSANLCGSDGYALRESLEPSRIDRDQLEGKSWRFCISHRVPYSVEGQQLILKPKLINEIFRSVVMNEYSPMNRPDAGNKEARSLLKIE